ncbi:MAG: NAD-binding protein, partial [Halomonas sp.]|nr:NAD-binding protein [Halomonas sp.]
QPIAAWLFKDRGQRHLHDADRPDANNHYQHHVIICGYGRTGQVISRFLEHEAIPFVALDMDPTIVKEARLAGHPVFYGDASDSVTLESIGIGQSTLVIIGHDDRTAALRTLQHIKNVNSNLPVVVRTRDESGTEELREAGATEVIPETLESGMVMAMHSLLALNVPMWRVTQRLQEQRIHRYPMLKELFRGNLERLNEEDNEQVERLHSVLIEEGSPCLGKKLRQYDFESLEITVTALVRNGERLRYTMDETELSKEDVVVLLGTPEALEKAERQLKGVF